MNAKKFSEAINEVDDKYYEEAANYRHKKPLWLKWAAMAACLCIAVISVFTLIPGTRFWVDEIEIISEGTLPGALEIYPTVMVNNHLYEWRKGAAIAKELPDDTVLYGDITHVEGNAPQNDCEFVSTFDVTGEIYIIENNSNLVYLKITTEWLEDTIVIFDLVK